MYSPTKADSQMTNTRIGTNKKVYIIKGKRKIKATDYSSKILVSKSVDSK